VKRSGTWVRVFKTIKPALAGERNWNHETAINGTKSEEISLSKQTDLIAHRSGRKRPFRTANLFSFYIYLQAEHLSGQEGSLAPALKKLFIGKPIN
jgi:hypothetical protein